MKIYCRHHDYCRTRQFSRINCLTESAVQGCASYRFYEKYPNYDGMGVGSKI
jgi:hypothetical protein